MLPPMAIFFPLFTMLEDFGYLPRVAFNLDRLFQKAGAHGKQALTHGDGLRLQRGRSHCDARHRFAARAAGRDPHQQLRAVQRPLPDPDHAGDGVRGAAFPPAFASLAAAGSVVAIVLIGVVFTLAVSWVLSRTMLKGEASAFTLELPPYRRPGILRILYTSLIDRTLFVLWRAMLTAAPAGAVIWLLGNIYAGGAASRRTSPTASTRSAGRSASTASSCWPTSSRFPRTRSWSRRC